MAVTIRGGAPVVVPTTGHPVSTTLTGAWSPIAGDLIVVFHGNDYYALSNMNVPTVGGTPMTPVVNGSADAGNPNAHVIAYVFPVAVSGDVVVQATETGAHDEDKVMSVWVLPGADLVNPIDGGAAGAAGSFSSTSTAPFVFTGVTPTTATGFLLYHMNSGGGSSAGHPFGTPAGMTQAYTAAVGGISYTGGYQQLSASGATGTRTVTSGGGSISWAGVLLAIKASAGTDVVYTDTSGGGESSGSSDTLSRTFVDTSGGGESSGSADTLARAFVDTSGGGESAGSPDGLARVFVDTSGGATGGGSGDVLDHVLVDTSGGGSSASSPDTLVTPKIYTDSSGGAGSVGSPEPAGSTAIGDGMVMPILAQALQCLREQLALVASPPAHYQIRPGVDAEPSADQYGSECCDGLAVVTVTTNYESSDQSWTEPAGAPDNCPPLTWAVQIEMKVLRCVPLAADRRGGSVTDVQWLAAAQAQADDMAALRRVLCCMRDVYGVSSVASGGINPLPLSGGCGGVTLQMTVQAPACDCE